MRSNGVRKWRPLVGVAVLGVIALAWSIQGVAEEKYTEVSVTSSDAPAPVVANVPVDRTPATQGPGLEGAREIVVGTQDASAWGVPVTNEVPSVATLRPGQERRVIGGVGARDVGDPCICDADCGDGDPCTYDWCDLTPGRQVIGECKQNTTGAEDRDCDDGDEPGDAGYCTMGACDDAGNCDVDQGGSPCTGDDICDDVTDNRCEHPGCQDPPEDPPCDDGVYCNGLESCNGDQQCDDGPDPCPGAPCDEDTETCGDPYIGRCCYGPEGYETCDETRTLAQCDALGWYCQGDPGSSCTVDEDCDGGATGPCIRSFFEALGHCDCPKYSAGWAPAGDFIWQVGPIQNQPCPYYYQVGDDYTAAHGEYLSLEEFKFVGGVECVGNADGRVLFEFWDASEPPLKVNEIRLNFECSADAGNHMWTITLGVPFMIPDVGYVTLKMRDGSTDVANWLSTDAVDVGTNNPALLWVDLTRGPHLSPDDPDILAMELYGVKVLDPFYACCDDDGNCENLAPWVCTAQGDNTVLGAYCEDDPYPCLKGACCLADGTCCDDSNDDVAPCLGRTDSPAVCEVDPGDEWQGYGTDCVPDCCLQPVFTGGDDCDLAVVHEVVVPPFGGGAVEITISGNNATASVGECNPSSEGVDRGWYEAFNLVVAPGGDPAECARVTIDECCTDPVPGASYVIVMEGCSEALDDCGDSVFCDEYEWTTCFDGNMTNIWESIPGGTYHYPILSDDQEYPGCLRPYQVHIVVEGCDEQACCLPPAPVGTPAVRCAAVSCIETHRIACEAADGWFMADVPLCYPALCDTGACCIDPGVCDDASGLGISCTACLAQSSEIPGFPKYFGGALCEDGPCPVCPYYPEDDTENCIMDEEGDYIVYIDRSAVDPGDPYVRWADDFVTAEGGGALERVCWWPCFFEPDTETECYQEPPASIDEGWRVVIYANKVHPVLGNMYMPGECIYNCDQPPSIQLVPDAKAWRGENSRCWEYSAPVDGGPVLAPNTIYWLEITGYGVQEGCQVYWATNCNGDIAGDSDSYSVVDTAGEWGPEDVVMLVGGGTTSAVYSDCINLSFCVNVTIQGDITDMEVRESIPGACIVCGEEGPECDDARETHYECRDGWGPTTDPPGVTFIPGMTDCTDGYCKDLGYTVECDTVLQDCAAGPCVPRAFCQDELTKCDSDADDCPVPDQPCEAVVEVPLPPPNDACDPDAIHLHDGSGGDPCPGWPCGPIPFDNTCAVTDGPDPNDTCTVPPDNNNVPMGADIWYMFHAQANECGLVTFDTCTNGTYDGSIVVYGNGTGTCDCPPADCLNTPDGPNCDAWQASQMACGDDTCGVGGGMGTVDAYVMENQCYLVRVGGWAGEMGSGELRIIPPDVWDPCGDKPPAPLPEDCGRIPPDGTGPTGWGERCQDHSRTGAFPSPPWCCNDDQCRDEAICVYPWPLQALPAAAQKPYTGYCVNDVSIPCDPANGDQDCIDAGVGGACHDIGNSYVGCCVGGANDGQTCDWNSGGAPCPAECSAEPGEHAGVCYAPKTRYLSVAQATPIGGARVDTAMRVSLEDGTVLGWFGPPTWVDPPGPPPGLCVALIQDTPYYDDDWKCDEDDGSFYLYPPYYVVHGYGCEIAHASLCADMSTHCKPNNPCPAECTNYMYCVQSINIGAPVGDEGNYSECLWLNTASTSGDTVSNCGGNVCKPADGVPGLADIMAAIFYFQGNLAAPMVWVDIAPSTGDGAADQNVGLGDIMAAIGGFQGAGYAGNGPKHCGE